MCVICSIFSGLCQEILLWFLGKSEASAALLMLRRLSGLQAPESDVAPGFHFTAGSDGGARLSCREGCRWIQQHVKSAPRTLSASHLSAYVAAMRTTSFTRSCQENSGGWSVSSTCWLNSRTPTCPVTSSWSC